ncbi:MAG: hypothetical protein COU71_01965 [Parcubacteria group bacterium CG10_big_fil_rev_8_21_14_0_10_38_31]|nr:MAG: hypothetical protein COU71_01965 [Parcubacteria group bacterium CG10_big_fil_rev_8_21_14_0_10_38_31]
MKNTFLIGLIALAIGLGAGYYYGNTTGVKSGVEVGKADLLAEQKKVAEDEAKATQDKILEQVNPFSDTNVNPFESEYVNPFEGTTVNPFAK